MANCSRIKVISGVSREFSTNISVDNVNYHIQTENMGSKSARIITNIYHEGEIIVSKKSDYSHLLKLKGSDEKIAALMENQHKSAINNFVAEQTRKQKFKADYFAEVQQLLRRGNGKQALETLREGLTRFPEDPFLLSYYGCLIAIVEDNPKEGIRICEGAIKRLEVSIPFGSEFFYPAFYLNLGRAYLKGNRKTNAIKAFQQGLKNDPDNTDIRWELRKLGSRRKPPLPFLRRNHPINKYIGMLLGKTSK
jgi:tetratricopeptide (TPR) repeat protein